MAKVTRGDVAREAGVSESTVSRALRDSPLISPEVRERVKETAERLGYVPSRPAAMLAAQKTHRLGLVIRSAPPYLPSPGPFTRAYFPRLLDGVLLRAEERGYTVTVILDSRNGKEKDLSELIHSREVDGLIFSVTPLEDKRFDKLRKKQIPFVLINNKVEQCLCINGNPRTGMEQAFRLMKEKGVKKAGYVSGDQAYYDGRIRLKTFCELSSHYSLETVVFPGDFSKTCGYRSGDFFFKENSPPECIMTGSDRTALGLLHYCREQGISVPGDVGLIGYDDLGPGGDSFPALTTVKNPVGEMGAAAVDRLISLLEGEDLNTSHWELETSMTVRDSL